MDDKNFDLLIHELQTLRSAVDKIGEDVSNVRVDMAKIKTEVKFKSALMGSLFGLIGPILYFLKKHLN